MHGLGAAMVRGLPVPAPRTADASVARNFSQTTWCSLASATVGKGRKA
jgi:hypothetical protein